MVQGGDSPGPEPAPAEPPAQAELTEAEKYAVIYPDRAARIRARRGLPARLDFGPPEPEIVEALVTGTSPILRELDQRQEVVAGSAPSSQIETMRRPRDGYAARCRSRRNWKNSTPSRSRRFIICGLRTISPTIEAIFGARK